MTEQEWFAITDWRSVRQAVQTRKGYTRKIRLFSVACCRRISHLFKDARAHEAVDVCELYADGNANAKQLQNAETTALASIREEMDKNGATPVAWARDAAWRTARTDSIRDGAVSCLRALNQLQTEIEAQTIMFRDIFTRPGRRPKCEKSWLTSDVLALARGIYDDRAFDRMPILADALQDAGCNSDDFLNLCRDATLLTAEPSPAAPDVPSCLHARGCWVIDLLLGK